MSIINLKMKQQRYGTMRTLMALVALCCLTISEVDGRPQFTNLRVFSAAEVLTKGFWRSTGSVKSSKSNDAPDEDLVAVGRSSDSSPIKRVSMATLLQQLQQAGQARKSSPFVLSTSQDEAKIDVKVESQAKENAVESPKQKDSAIRRVLRPNGAVVYSRNLNGQTSGQNIIVKINPHQLSTTTTTTTSTTEATTTTTTEPRTSTTSTPKPAKARDESGVNTLRPYSNIIGKKKSEGLIKASEGEKKLRANSPIYYIKLPSSAFVPTTIASRFQSIEPETKQIFVATTSRPGASNTTTAAGSTNLSTTTRKPGLTNSRIIRLKGPFVFNGKPGDIYSAPAPYRPPNYWDILHSLYPKLRKAQFIRR